MDLENLVNNAEIITQLLKLIILGLSSSVYIYKKLNKEEKNQYLKLIKKKSSLKEAFSKIHLLNYSKILSLFSVWAGAFIGLIYILISVYVLIFVLNLLDKSNTSIDPLLFFGVNPINETISKLIFCTYINFCLIPLLLITLILAYLMFLRTEKHFITPNLVKRKWFGKMVQMLQYRIWNLAEKTEPRFTKKMELTMVSKILFYLFSFLIGIFLMMHYIIFISTYSILKEVVNPFTLSSVGNLYNLSISIKTTLPDNWTNLIYIDLLSLLISFALCSTLYAMASSFLDEGKEKIIRFYSKGYPFVSITKSSGRLSGKVEDIFNEHIIILNDNGIQKITSWDDIISVEINTDEKQL